MSHLVRHSRRQYFSQHTPRQRTSLCDILLPLLSTAFDSPRTHPRSRIWTVDHSFLARQHRQAEEYASLRYPLSPLAGTGQIAALRDDGDGDA